MHGSGLTHAHGKQHAYMGRVQLRRVAWDSYVRSPTGVTRETSNDKFTIQEPILPIASKRRVTHYSRVTKKRQNKHGLQPQLSTKQTRCSYELKRYIYVVSIRGSCLNLLWVALTSWWLLSLISISSFLNGSCLYLNLFYSRWLAPQFWCTRLISRRICTQVLYSSFLFLS